MSSGIMIALIMAEVIVLLLVPGVCKKHDRKKSPLGNCKTVNDDGNFNQNIVIENGSIS